MRRAIVSSLCLAALLFCACAEDEPLPTPVTDPVQISGREPGPGCRLLQAVEVRSGRGEDPAHAVLSNYAAEQRSNYVVLDGFTVLEEPEESVVIVRARLFCCPLVARR